MSPRRRLGLLLLLPLLVIAATAAPALAHGEEKPIWACPMDADVRRDQPGQCPKCGMDLVCLNPPAASAAIKPKPLMPGVPDWLFYAGSLGVLVASFLIAEVANRRAGRARARAARLNLLRGPLRAAVKHPWFKRAVEIPVVLLFLLVLAAGLLGNQEPARNIAPVLTWTIWWTWLAFLIIFVGKLWCTTCPWMAIADWTSALLGKLRGTGAPFSLAIPWPRALRNIWLATSLFVFLTWLELGYGVTEKPWLTAYLALFMVAASVATVLVFERKSFCRYACLVGRVSGLYATFAASELRSIDRARCRRCQGKDCFHGRGHGKPCPTHQFLGFMDQNTYCTMCLECVKACPEDNIAWNLRPPGADLFGIARPRADEAYLAVTMLSMSAFHGLSMTPSWDALVARIQGLGLGLSSHLAAFSAGMFAVLLAPLLLYYLVCAAMFVCSRDRRFGPKLLFIRFAYSLLPIALFYHLAHNVQHIVFEGKKLIRLSSDPFGWGWDLFGTSHLVIDAVLPLGVAWAIQVGLILVGHVFGILVAHKIAHDLYGGSRAALRSQIPILLAMLGFSFQSLWLVAQPMMMRTAM